jgi:hypothetical protein
MPLISGDPYSGGLVVPVGGLQVRADKNNSGNVYLSLSGAFVFSGQVGCLPTSGGPTITSGAMPLSGGVSSGLMDGFPLGPGDAFFIPRSALLVTGAYSGTYQPCVGCDPAASGQARIHLMMI